MSLFLVPQYSYKSKRVSILKSIQEGRWNHIADIEGPGIIKHIWITYPHRNKNFGRQCIIRIFWDDETTPSVESPLADFFCVPMGFTGKEYAVNNYFISVLPNNGFNCYFPMPFAKTARIELFMNEQKQEFVDRAFYFQADYEYCKERLPSQWKSLRFHAKYRMESPTEEYGHRYLTLNAEGEGYLVGTSYGIRRRHNHPDFWFHGGGDQIFIDGETDPDILHGIGAEDYFGQSWGIGTSNSTYVGTPYYQEFSTDNMDYFNLVLYRFFAQDPVYFKHSIIHMLGAMGDSVSSVAYWYQKEPHLDFFTMPVKEDLYQEANIPRNKNDLCTPYTHTWNVFGPIKDEQDMEFDKVHAIEKKQNFQEKHTYRVKNDVTMDVKWEVIEAPRGFTDFHIVMRPTVFTIALQTSCYGFALGYLEVGEDMEVLFRIGFDDRIRCYCNEELVFEDENSQGFDNKYQKASLKKGKNKILIKLSNTNNTNFRSWTFNFGVCDLNKNHMKELIVNPYILASK